MRYRIKVSIKVDKTGFKNIFDIYFDAIRSYIYYRCADEQVASDIAQDVFMRVWEKRHTLDSGNIKSLLYKIARDMTVSHFRKVSVRMDFSKDMTMQNQPNIPDEQLQCKELQKRYSDALARLPDDQRETFLMSRNDELKYGEIAERLQISVKAVEKRMSAALRFLKERLL